MTEDELEYWQSVQYRMDEESYWQKLEKKLG